MTRLAAGDDVHVGDAAPDFTLSSTRGGTRTLLSLRGESKVLLAFFPLAFTSVCTQEMCAFYEDVDRFSAAGTHVLGISVDSTPVHREFQYKNGIQTELLSDFKREVSARYGVLDAEHGYARRAYVLIDRDGVVRWKHIEPEIDLRRSNDEILEQIRLLD
jgi:peroxiredoxin